MLATANCLHVAEEQEAYLLGVLNNVRGNSEWLVDLCPEEIAKIVQGIKQLKLSKDVHGRVIEQLEQIMSAAESSEN